MPLQLRDIVITPVTPFTEALEIDQEAYRGLIRYIAGLKGVGGIICNAHAGEGSALSREEKQLCVRLAKEAAGGHVPVIACAEAYATREAVRLINDAENEGAEAVMVCPPPVYSWVARRSPEVGAEFFKEISKKTTLPLIVFQYWDGAQHSYSHEGLMRILRENEKVIAVKMAHGSNMLRYMEDATAIRSLGRPVSIMPASGYLFLSHCMFAADGGITGFAQFAPQVIDLYLAIKSGDLSRAQELDLQLRPLAAAIEADPFFYFHDRYKEATKMVGLIPNAFVRGPSIPIGDDERAALRKALEQSGVLAAAATQGSSPGRKAAVEAA